MNARRALYMWRFPGVVLSVLMFAILMYAFAQQHWWAQLFGWFFPDQSTVLFERASLWDLVLQHLVIVGSALAVILAIGMPLGVWLTRPQGRAFLPLASNLLAVGQTFPPVAVLALALPFFGFGLVPALIALVAYGLLPVTRNTIAGLEAISPTLLEAGRGMGMNGRELLWQVELPLAMAVIVSGIRTSAVYTMGTATIAPIIGTGGLGVPIIAGLSVRNLALVLEGALPVALLALVLDYTIGQTEALFRSRGLSAREPGEL